MESTAATLKPELIEELMKLTKSPADLFGPEGLFHRLKGALMERMLEAEMTEHLGFERNAGRHTGNSRNGHSIKTVKTESGPVEIRVPRDRAGTFEPQLVSKHQRRLEGFDEKVLALYASGMSTREIQSHLEELYGTEVSPDLISRVTESVMSEARAWQARPLEAVYPIVYLDALFVSIRDGAAVKKKAVYVALGMRLDGQREVLGLWFEGTEGARFWLHVLTELKSRGVEDILFVCCDGLSGFPQAIEAAFPRTIVQTCIVHLIRSSLRYVPWGDRRALIADLKTIYGANTELEAETALVSVEKKWSKRYPSMTKQWRNRWQEIVPFLAFPPEIRKILYTTNAVESLNSQLRKVLRPKGSFPNDDAVFKLLYLALAKAKHKWSRPVAWTQALAHLAIMFPDRLPA
jgi:putative transposase